LYNKAVFIGLNLIPNPLAIFVNPGLPNYVRNFVGVFDVVQGFLFPIRFFYHHISWNCNHISRDVGHVVYRQLLGFFFDGLRFVGNAIARIDSALHIFAGFVDTHKNLSGISNFLLALIPTIERKISLHKHLPRGGSFSYGDRRQPLPVGRGFSAGPEKT
jgi:hypothetical protein